MASFVLGLIGGILAWAVAETLAKPYRRFRRLRSEVLTTLELYERWNPWGTQSGSPAWLAEREHAYRARAAQLLAFDGAEWIVPRLLPRFKIGLPDAGFALLELSYLPHDAAGRPRARKDALRQLRLKDAKLKS